MKALFLLLGPVNFASSRVRGFWVIEELEKQGIKCTVIPGSKPFSLLKCALLIPFYDSLVAQKRYAKWDYYLLKFAALLRKKTIIDLDDKYSRTNNEVTLKNLIRCMKTVSAVTVGSQALLNFVGQYQVNAYLLATSVRLNNYKPTEGRVKNKVTLGWIGNGRHYHADLIKILKAPLQRVASQHNITLKLVGVCGQEKLYEAFQSIPGLKIHFIDSLDWSDGSAVQQAVSDFDIGLYPLEENEFNQYKCGFKALEYMATGIPVIASSVGANKDIISNGVDGFLVDNEEDWVNAISTLVQDDDLRLSMGSEGRKKVEREYDVKNHAQKLSMILNARE